MAQEHDPAAPAIAPPEESRTEVLIPASRVEALVEKLATEAIALGLAKLDASFDIGLRIGRAVHHVTRRRLDDAVICELALVAGVDEDEAALELAVWTGNEWQAQRHVEHGAERGAWHWPAECARKL